MDIGILISHHKKIIPTTREQKTSPSPIDEGNRPFEQVLTIDLIFVNTIRLCTGDVTKDSL